MVIQSVLSVGQSVMRKLCKGVVIHSRMGRTLLPFYLIFELNVPK